MERRQISREEREAEARRRFKERGDRCVGSAEVSAQFLYPKTEYDLCIDSSNKSPAALAEEIVRSLT